MGNYVGGEITFLEYSSWRDDLITCMKGKLVNLMDVLLPVVAVAFEKQLHLANIVGNYHWSFSMDSGQVTFGSDLSFNVQILGTEADDSQTWLWAWANEASGIPAALLKSSNQLRAYGQQHNIHVLTQVEIPLDDTHNGHYVSLLASGLLKANGYYRGPYPGGALFMLIDDPQFPVDDRDPVQRVVSTFPQLISAITVPDHHQAFIGYVQSHQLTLLDQDTPNVVQAQAANGQTIEAKFDSGNRLVNINARLHK